MDSGFKSRQILVVRWIYFFYYSAFGIFFTYANVYFRDIGLKGAEIGLINTLAPLMGMFGGPLWGMLSDRFRGPRLVLLISVFGGIMSVLALSIAPSLPAIILATAAYTLFVSAFTPLLDSINFSLLGKDRDRYGRQRVFGSLGFIASSWLFGFILQQSGLHALFMGCAVGLLLTLPGLAMLKVRPVEPASSPTPGLNQTVWKPSWLLFAASLVVIGIVNAGLNNFLGIYIKELGGGEALIGIAASLGVLTELPVMYYSSTLLRRFGSRGMMAIGFGFFSIRMLLYALMPSPNWALPIALLHGLTFAPYWVGSVSYANELAPDNLKATAQGAFMSLLNLSAVAGSAVNGGLYDWFGSSGLFLVNSVLGVVALLVLGIRLKKQPSKPGIISSN